MTHWMRMTMIVVAAGMAATVQAAFTGDAWPMSTAAWNAGNGTQGQYGNWSFKWSWAGNDSPSGFTNATWDAAHGGWDMSWNQNMSGNDTIYRTNVLMWYNPTYAIIAWTAPADGTYPLTVSADIAVGWWDTETRPIELSIQLKDGTFLLPKTSYNATSTTRTVALYNGDITVKAGDVLYFRTQNAGGDSIYESASWNIQIPEPASLALLFLGVGGLLFRRR